MRITLSIQVWFYLMASQCQHVIPTPNKDQHSCLPPVKIVITAAKKKNLKFALKVRGLYTEDRFI